MTEATESILCPFGCGATLVDGQSHECGVPNVDADDTENTPIPEPAPEEDGDS